jgi:hypothetical protein
LNENVNIKRLNIFKLKKKKDEVLLYKTGKLNRVKSPIHLNIERVLGRIRINSFPLK